jgi:hypothetical protein
MDYIPVTSTTNAQAISVALWQLSRPSSIRSARDRTSFYTSWHTHPSTGEVVLAVPDDEIPIFPDSQAYEKSLNALKLLIQPFATEEEVVSFEAAIAQHPRIKLSSITPATLWEQRKTMEDLVDEGWFPTSEDLEGE